MNDERKPKEPMSDLVSTFYKIAMMITFTGLFVLVGVFGVRWYRFKHFFPVGNESGEWGTLGDFIGGTANPILSFLTIVLLAVTLILQSKQLSISSNELRLSREELEFTRKELERSAAAQELSEQALRAQAKAAEVTAKLATLNALTEYYDKEIRLHSSGNITVGSLAYAELDGLRERRKILDQLLEQYYMDLTGIDEK
jgi:hypothetical protein